MRVWISTAFFLLCLSSLPAQQFYFRVGGGYGWAASGEDYGQISITTTNSVEAKVVYGTNGVGIMPFVAVGYRFHEFLSFQLEGEYVGGREQTRFERLEPFYSSLTTERSQQLRLVPTLVLGRNSRKVNPFMKLGLSVPIWTRTEIDFSEEVFLTPVTAIQQRSELKGKSLLGFSGGWGVQVALTDQLGVSLEVGAISQRLKAQSGRITFLEVDGVDQLADLDAYDSEWTYQESLTSEDNNGQLNPAVDRNQAEDRLQISQNFSSIYLKLGFQFSLPTSGN